jgi:hypothetical protein
MLVLLTITVPYASLMDVRFSLTLAVGHLNRLLVIHGYFPLHHFRDNLGDSLCDGDIFFSGHLNFDLYLYHLGDSKPASGGFPMVDVRG